MFLKPFKFKSIATLKCSEAKKLRQRLQVEYPNTKSDLLIPAKSNVTVIKLITHNEVQTTAYCVDKLPMFFETEEKKLVPTLYSLWQVPDLLPYFTTQPAVLPPLTNGANLMLQDIIPLGTGRNIFGDYEKGQLVAINLTSNESAVGVGYLLHSSDDLFMNGVDDGVGVVMLHFFGDKLWGHEPQLVQQIPLPRVTNLVDSAESPETQLKNAFLSALKNHGKSLQLPLLTSNFYRLYVVPEAKETIDLKKTKYKKLSNFLNEMTKQGFIVVKEESKGVDKITFIDFEHPELVNFITDFKPTHIPDADGTVETPLFHPKLTELYIVTAVTAPLFTKFYYKRGEGIPVSRVKKIIREYVRQVNLPLSKDPQAEESSYVLDECLQEICDTNLAPLSRIISAVISQMQHSYQMCNVKNVTGNKPMITMSLAGIKWTLVSNIECCGIILREFTKLCKQGAGTSATIVTPAKQNRKLIRLQGNQIRFLYRLLTQTYKIPSKFISVLEFKKGRKTPKVLHKKGRRKEKKPSKKRRKRTKEQSKKIRNRTKEQSKKRRKHTRSELISGLELAKGGKKYKNCKRKGTKKQSKKRRIVEKRRQLQNEIINSKKKAIRQNRRKSENENYKNERVNYNKKISLRIKFSEIVAFFRKSVVFRYCSL